MRFGGRYLHIFFISLQPPSVKQEQDLDLHHLVNVVGDICLNKNLKMPIIRFGHTYFDHQDVCEGS